MCGRFTLTTNDYESVAKALGAQISEQHARLYRPRFNVAPTDQHFIVCREGGGRVLLPATWGMPGSSRGVDMHINARGETAAKKQPFRTAFLRTRCGVVADGFYEWSGPKDRRKPTWFHAPDRRVLMFAGLFRDREDSTTGRAQRYFTILTTDANPTVDKIHDRMPVILADADIDLWLAPPPGDGADEDAFRATLQAVMRPTPEGVLVGTAVSRRVNSVRNDDPQCLDEDPESRQGSLF